MTAEDTQWTRLVCGWAAAPAVRDFRGSAHVDMGGAAHVGDAPVFDLASTLYVARIAAHMSVADLALAIGTHESTVTDYESGRAVPPAATVVSLENILQARLRM